METRIIYPLKGNQGNLKGSEARAHLEKSDHVINLKNDGLNKDGLYGFVGEPDIMNHDVCFQINNESSRNIIIACINESLSFRIAMSVLVTLYKQKPDSKFYVLNYIGQDNEESNYLNNIQELIELEISNNETTTNEFLNSIKNEIENRIKNRQFDEKKIFLTILSYQRAYEFRRVDYSNSKVGELLEYIFKEGSQVGVFVILSIDSFTSLNKNTFELDEFTLRLVGQVDLRSSAVMLDGRNPIFDSKDAFELEENRAIFYDCKRNKMIKFIPYELPNIAWLSVSLNQPKQLI